MSWISRRFWISPSVTRNPAASSASCPGVRMVMLIDRVLTRISSGSSTPQSSTLRCDTVSEIATMRRDFAAGEALADARGLVMLGFGQEPLVGAARVRIGFTTLVYFVALEKALLLRPAFVDTFETPFDAPARGADRFVIHQHKDRIRVR